jgi:septal ring factor EnvC (AmiA/AmiB activator)
VQDACAIHINPKKLKRYGRQHDALIAKEQQLNEKEESLRQSNRELVDAIQRLETSLKKLQEEHQDVAAQVITSKVDLARLDSNNSELRRQNSILRRQLEELPTHIEARWKSQFDALCADNADLVQRNSALEDTLTVNAIPMDLSYAVRFLTTLCVIDTGRCSYRFENQVR